MSVPSQTEDKAAPRIEELITQVPYKPPFFLSCLRSLYSCFKGTNILPFHDEENDLLLPEKPASLNNKKTIVIDLDETLVHSAFSVKKKVNYVLNITYNARTFPVYVRRRPGVDKFLKKCGELFEVVIFTASVSEYADPLIDTLDVDKVVKHRLYRQDCTATADGYVKDLSRLNRPLKDIFILDNSHVSYMFQPENALPIKSWFKDRRDKELTKLFPLLKNLSECDDVREILGSTSKSNLKPKNVSHGSRKDYNSPLTHKTNTVETQDQFKCERANNSFD